MVGRNRDSRQNMSGPISARHDAPVIQFSIFHSVAPVCAIQAYLHGCGCGMNSLPSYRPCNRNTYDGRDAVTEKGSTLFPIHIPRGGRELPSRGLGSIGEKYLSRPRTRPDAPIGQRSVRETEHRACPSTMRWPGAIGDRDVLYTSLPPNPRESGNRSSTRGVQYIWAWRLDVDSRLRRSVRMQWLGIRRRISPGIGGLHVE